jgi:hypothetical protein
VAGEHPDLSGRLLPLFRALRFFPQRDGKRADPASQFLWRAHLIAQL